MDSDFRYDGGGGDAVFTLQSAQHVQRGNAFLCAFLHKVCFVEESLKPAHAQHVQRGNAFLCAFLHKVCYVEESLKPAHFTVLNLLHTLLYIGNPVLHGTCQPKAWNSLNNEHVGAFLRKICNANFVVQCLDSYSSFTLSGGKTGTHWIC